MVAAPSTSVSSRPRRLSMRSVKTWPRSRSAPSWTSSTATKATSRSRGIASTVDTQNRGLAGLIFSSPVISATASAPDPLAHLVVDLAREQPQRQPDHARGMRQHPLDGEVGLAGVGRPEHRGDAMTAGTRIALPRRTERDRHSSLRSARTGRRITSKGATLYHNATKTVAAALSCRCPERVSNKRRPNR